MKKLSIILMCLLAAVQLAVPFSLILKKEKILREGQVFRFLTAPIDPADPFQGRYVWLGYQHNFIDVSEEEKPDIRTGAKLFALISTGDDGFARFTGWSMERPENGAYLETRYRGAFTRWNRDTRKHVYKGLRIDIPFDRFYMDEAKAPRAEVLAREATRHTNCWAEVRVLDGKAVIEDVYAEGQSLRMLAAEKE